jgi:AcrR family transcriptional regulator
MVNSRERLLAAAEREFAAKGYDGAAVDDIARAAGLNKAMIYYHFDSKAGLYRAIIRGVFEAVLRVVDAEVESVTSPEQRIRRFVLAIADAITMRPHFPALWLDEFATGLRHLDASTLAVAGRVVGTLGRILGEGERQGVFRHVSPLKVHIGIVAPLLLFAASAVTRDRLARANLPEARTLTLERMVEHVTESTLAVLRRREGDLHV